LHARASRRYLTRRRSYTSSRSAPHRAAQAAYISTPPPHRTKWTRHVPHPVLIGHVASAPPTHWLIFLCFSTSKDSERARPPPRPRAERAARGAQVASGEVMNAVRKAEALSQDVLSTVEEGHFHRGARLVAQARAPAPRAPRATVLPRLRAAGAAVA
jgi:hypothetical protein